MKQVMQKQTASNDMPQIEMHNVTKLYGRGTDDEYRCVKLLKSPPKHRI